MKNVILISPEHRDTFWSFKHALWFVRKKAAFVPYGLLVVAALLPRAWRIKLVDLNVRRITPEDIRGKDYAFVGAMVSQTDSTKEVIALCNSLGVHVILGGPGLETEESCSKFPGVSHYVIGKAEGVLPVLLSDLEQGCAKLVYKADRVFPIEDSPIPRYDLVNPKDYGSASVQFSVSCPHHCTFCSETVIDPRPWRCKSTRRFLDELEVLYKSGFRNAVQICDANFIGDPDRTKQMLVRLVEWQKNRKFPYRFTVEASVLLADNPELMDLMVASGIEKVFLGLESPDEDCLRECGKLQNVGRDLVADVWEILRHGIIPLSGFMTGSDSDKPATFDRNMIRFIIDSCIGPAMVGAMQAQPGTALYRKLQMLGRLLGDAVNNTGYESNFVTVMGTEAQVKGTRHIVETINSPKIYGQRICNLLERLDVSKRPPKKLRVADVEAFARSIWRIGIRGPAEFRRCYWKVIKFAFSKHRAAFPDAVALLIYGWHFQKSEKH